FDKLKCGVALLLPKGIAQQASQQADILPQGIVLYGSVLIFDLVFFETPLLGSKRRSHSATSCQMPDRADAMCTSVRLCARHAKMCPPGSSIIFSCNIMHGPSMPTKIVIATRESLLAMWQANFI